MFHQSQKIKASRLLDPSDMLGVVAINEKGVCVQTDRYDEDRLWIVCVGSTKYSDQYKSGGFRRNNWQEHEFSRKAEALSFIKSFGDLYQG